MPAGVGEFGMDCVPLGYFGVDETLGGLRTSGRFWVDCVPVGYFGEFRTSERIWADCVPSVFLVSKIFTL